MAVMNITTEGKPKNVLLALGFESMTSDYNKVILKTSGHFSTL